MGRRSIPITQAIVARAIKGVLQAGQQVAAIRIEPDGSIQLVFGAPQSVPSSPDVNPWD